MTNDLQDLIQFVKILQDLAWQDLTKSCKKSYKMLQELTKILQDFANILTRSYQHLSRILPRDLTRSFQILPASWQDLTNYLLIRFFLGSYKIYQYLTRSYKILTRFSHGWPRDLSKPYEDHGVSLLFNVQHCPVKLALLKLNQT